MNIRKDIVDYIYFGIFGLIMILFLTGQFSSITGTSLVVIDNSDPNSMFPTYFQGDLFVIYRDSPSDIHIGDVIVYEKDNGARIIHRVVDIYIEGGEYLFRVKGDDPVTNFIPDPFQSGTLIPFEAVLGEVVARAPFVGHISLAMQQNPVVQILIYVIAIGITIAIIFWPTDEDDEEDKYYNMSIANLKTQLNHIKSAIIGFLSVFITSKYRLLAWFFLFLIIFTGFIPYFLPSYLPSTTTDERGVVEVRIEDIRTLSEQNSDHDTMFANVFITFSDDGNLVDYIESYVMQVLDPTTNAVIDETKWNTLRPILGEFTIGGTITIDKDVYDMYLTNGVTELNVVVTPTVNGFGTYYDLDTFETTLILT